jgi:predicted component of type VI protein secretion system
MARMICLQILSGSKAGARWVARRFPVRIGRATANDLQLEDDGVWDEHLELAFDPTQGFVLNPRPNAIVAVNREAAQGTRLRNGDAIELGSVQMRFWLGETQQRGFRGREWFVWMLVAAMSLGQVALVYWLLQ